MSKYEKSEIVSVYVTPTPYRVTLGPSDCSPPPTAGRLQGAVAGNHENAAYTAESGGGGCEGGNGGWNMTISIDRAIEILDPGHRENYDGLEEVNEACRMGMEALQYRKAMLVTPHRNCPRCGWGLDVLWEDDFCEHCGQALAWPGDEETEA